VKLLVFDFDGLILDTEAPAYESWAEIYADHGETLEFEKWATCIGTHDTFDPCVELETRLARSLDAEAIRRRSRARCDEMIALREVLPGVRDYVVEARRLGLHLGVASSSSRVWVEGHLTRLGLREFFDVVRTSDDVPRVKPDPALYLSVLAAMGVRAGDAVALEDSPNGVLAAKRAGISCVAVPNPLTARLDLSAADLRLASLTELSLPALLAHLRV
jgi:HAD superfamily hydrolase (TIGR01509 family)